jgi:hypothetical protein
MAVSGPSKPTPTFNFAGVQVSGLQSRIWQVRAARKAARGMKEKVVTKGAFQ